MANIVYSQEAYDLRKKARFRALAGKYEGNQSASKQAKKARHGDFQQFARQTVSKGRQLTPWLDQELRKAKNTKSRLEGTKVESRKGLQGAVKKRGDTTTGSRSVLNRLRTKETKEYVSGVSSKLGGTSNIESMFKYHQATSMNPLTGKSKKGSVMGGRLLGAFR